MQDNGRISRCGTMVRSIGRCPCLRPDRSRRLQVLPCRSLNGPAMTLGSSPFKTIAEAAKTREIFLTHLTRRTIGPYRLAPRYVVHAALAKVCDALRAHVFSTSAMIEDTLILGCVWPLAAAT